MTVRANVEGGNLAINLYDLLGSLDEAGRALAIDALACTDAIINEVANQLIDGWTTEGSHGGTSYGGNVDAVHGIDGARMRIAKASSEIAAKEIERLGEAIKREKASCDYWVAQYHAECARQRRDA